MMLQEMEWLKAILFFFYSQFSQFQLSFLLELIFTCLIKTSPPFWLKIFGLLPLVPWVFIFAVGILEIDRKPFFSKPPKRYLLKYEVKTSRLLVNGRSQNRTNSGGSSGILPTPIKTKEGYIYSFRTGIERGGFKMNIEDDFMETEDYKLEFQEVDLLPITDWIPLQFIHNNPPETEASIRYSVVVSPYKL